MEACVPESFHGHLGLSDFVCPCIFQDSLILSSAFFKALTDFILMVVFFSLLKAIVSFFVKAACLLLLGFYCFLINVISSF